jgi:hypothetical protein
MTCKHVLIRLSPGLLLLVSLTFAQNPENASALVAKKGPGEAIGPNPITPTVIAPKYGSPTLPLPGLPGLPGGKTTLLGGTIQSLDHVRDRLVLEIFQEGHMSVLFDERTRVFRDGKATSLDDLENGDRAYVDTTLDGTAVFARSIRVSARVPAGQISGQIVNFRPESGELLVRDSLSTAPVKMHLASNANLLQGDHTLFASQLVMGSLVSLTFTSGKDKEPDVSKLSVLASPGTTYVFSGQIEMLDLRRGLLVVLDPRTHKTYDIHFDTVEGHLTRDLKQGSNVTVLANFTGTRYESRDITVNSQ